MKKRWMLGITVVLAVSLALGLFFNNFIQNMPARLYASEEDAATVSAGDAAVAVSDGDAGDSDSMPSTDAEDGAGTPATDAEGGEGTSATNAEDGEAVTMTVSDGDVQEISDAEAEEDMALYGDNLFMTSYSMMLLSASDSGVSLPTTEAEYQEAVGNGTTTFYITSYEQFLAAQDLCDTAEGFKGYTLVIASPPSGNIWYMDAQTEFSGIGTATNPFQGTLFCSYSSGIVLQMATPLFAYLGEGAEVYQLDMVSDGASAMLADTISGNVTIHDIRLSGAVSNEGGSAGIIAANVTDGSVVTLSDITQNGALSVSGSIAGGVAGMVGNNVIITLGDGVVLGSSSEKLTVSGTTAAGGHFGSVTGTCTWDLNDEARLCATVVANGSGAYAGQYAGMLVSTTDAPANVTIKNGTEVTVDVSGTGSGGGFVGLCTSEGESSSIVTITTSETFTINGAVSMSGAYAGGLIGDLYLCNVELKDYVLSATVTSGSYAGGMLGRVVGGRHILGDITVNGTLTGGTYTGGVIGYVTMISDACAIELQGTIDVLNATWNGSGKGSIVGQQVKSLIYTSEAKGVINGNMQLQCPQVSGDVVYRYLEINSYGGIFRNQLMDESAGTMLIGDGTLANVGVIHNTISKSGGYYLMGEGGENDAAGDWETLTIALYTEGLFGVSAFTGASSYTELLSASYQLNSNVDISYESTGIMSINRYDKVDNAAYAFSGELKGIDESITIKQDNRCNYWFKGVFVTLGGNAKFTNLTIEGLTRLGSNVGGLAYDSIGDSLTLENVHVKKQFTENYQALGGLMVKENNTWSTFTLNATNVTLGTTYSSGLEYASGFIVTMDNAIVNMDGVVLGGELKNTGAASGGFLGYNWTNTGGSIKNVSVAADGANYTVTNANNEFGGLVKSVSTYDTRLTLDTVDLSGLTVNMNNNAYCGLLIQDGQSLVLEVIDYDCSNCVISGTVGKYCDEIVAKSQNNSTEGQAGGIVSIHNREAGYFPAYHYEYQTALKVEDGNPYTLYFYDVFQRLEAEGTTIDKTLDTETEVLLWDIMHYATKGNVWNYFNKYWPAGTYESYSYMQYQETVTFSGNLNLSNISFYPVTRVNGGNYDFSGAVIAFNAAQMDAWNEIRQHEYLSAGLFMNTGYLYVTGLTLTGNVANEGAASGALVCGTSGLERGYIDNVVLQDLWIHNYSATQEEPGAGLLISCIPGVSYEEGKEPEDNYVVYFRHISMTGYNEETEAKAAAALIGSAGGENVYNLQLNFKYMKIADDRDDRSDGSHNGKVLAYASFLYNYTYTDDAKINKGNGLYLFTVKDYNSDDVTLGEELDFDTEYADTSDTVFKVSVDTAPAELYKPYVYQIKDIEVNPKSGDILKGCGTYEDPYIIETYKQLLTLYRYMNDTGTVGEYQYDSFYDGWQIIKMGDDSTFCEAKHSVTEDANGTFDGNGTEDIVSYVAGGTNEDFPTPDELSRAYYQLGADIDLSVDMGTTYAQIAQDFVGFGIVNDDINRPFTGVWYGKDADGTIHAITLPDKNADASYETYGFIQYAKGVVVKDMIIQTSETAEETAYARLVKAGGGVIACVLGGDNIIDNVTVKVKYRSEQANAVIGGYVGNVQKGGLILRNVSADALENFAVVADNITMPHLGAIAGKVEDGYVLYEGDGDSEVLWSGTLETEYSLIPAYEILNGDGLKAQADGISIEKAEVDEGKVAITITVPNAAALQVMSMALNADALNVRPSDYTENNVAYDCGYTELSRSRKAAYSHIGNATAENEDYILAATYDNVMDYSESVDLEYGYPYLYQYMGIEEKEYLDFLTGNYSILNPYTTIDDVAYQVQWKLQADTTYDMTVFGTGFRGLGALYGTNVKYGGTFRGDFDGQGSTIILGMDRTLYGADTSNTQVQQAALFNMLHGRDTSLHTQTADYADIGASAAELGCQVIEDFTLQGKISVSANSGSAMYAGGVASCINLADAGNMVFHFQKIKLQGDFQICGYGDDGLTGIYRAGGLVGYVGKNTKVLITDCHVQGTEDKPVTVLGTNSTAGLVGMCFGHTIKFVDCTLTHAVIQSKSDNAAGFTAWVGDTSNSTKYLICQGTIEDACSITECKITGSYRAGGFVGGTRSNFSIKNVKITNTAISAFGRIGGIVAAAEESHTSSIINAKVVDITITETNGTNSDPGGIGGIIGINYQKMTIQNATVSGTLNEDGEYQCVLSAIKNVTRTKPMGVGGIVGRHMVYSGRTTLNMENCTVDTVSMAVNSSTTKSQYECVGGLVGFVSSDIVLRGTMKTTNLVLSAPLGSEAPYTTTGAAGGCFGYVEGNYNSQYEYIITGADDEPFAGLTATGNTVSGKYAGGLIGHVASTNTGVRLTGIKVSDGTVTSDEVAGGVIGFIEPGYKGSVLENTATNIVQNMQISARLAGGAIGQLSIYGYLRMESLQIKDNSITSIMMEEAKWQPYAAGGVIGYCYAQTADPLRIYNVELNNNAIACEVADETLAYWEKDYIAAGGLIGWSDGWNQGAPVLCDNMVIAATNRIGIRKYDTSDIKLITYDSETSTYKLASPEVPTTEDTDDRYYDVLQNLAEEYGYYVGNFVGVLKAGQIELIVLRSDDSQGRFTQPVLNNNPPVTDVGRLSSQTVDAYREDCHIIYGATVADAAIAYTTDANTGTNLQDMKKQVDAANTIYAENTPLADILVKYHLSGQAVEWFEKLYQESFTFSEDKSIDFPILVYKTEYGTLQEIMECITDVMTNVAGASASDLPADYLSISCRQMLCSGMTVTEGNGTASITAVTSDGVTTYTSPCYDGLSDGKVTFTEITFVYGWAEHQKTFRLPIFVEEPILYGVHSMLTEGKVTDVDTIKAEGILEQNESIIMANDSDYTLLLEYTYGKARENMPDESYVDKVFYLTDTSGAKALALGTRLMLIDVTNGNKVYYYTVEDQNVTQVLFTDFKDSAGNSYTNTSINKLRGVVDEGEEYYTDLAGHKLSDTGVEMFLLTVLAPETAGSTNEVYTIHSGIQIEDEGLATRFDTLEEHAEEALYSVKSIPGLEINFINKGTGTDIEGAISRDGGLTVKASIYLSAKDGIYWAEKGSAVSDTTVIDSSNNGKYLDVAFYLRDTSGNRVNLPSGTNFSYRIADELYSEMKVISNNSVIYYYKDIRDVFDREDSEYLIGNITQNTTVNLEFYLDFSGADSSNITEDLYVAWLELLRTSNKDYPMSSDSKLDDYHEDVEASATQELGFSLRAYELYQLAINTYPKPSEQDTIDYNLMFDFSDILKQTSGAGTDALVEKWAGFDYTVSYQIYKKTENGETVTYEPYTGEDIVLMATQAVNSAGEKVTVTSTNGQVTALYRFTAEELEENEGLMILPGEITIATQSLAEDLKALTNYKVQATLNVTERGTNNESAEQTVDFFIYTITRLKTDI